jgi:hypothetical protein
MACIAGTHGVLNFGYFERAGRDLAAATDVISRDWATWLADGLGRCGLGFASPRELPVAYYADCLDRGVAMGSEEDPARLEPFAQELFITWVESLRGEPPDESVAQAGPLMRMLVRQPAEYLTRRYGQAVTGLISVLCAELATYFADQFESRRHAAWERVTCTIMRHQPRVLLAHSLGSVVAYEALCGNPDLAIDLLVTLGSPLGVPGVVFDRLLPPAEPGGVRPRPAGVRCWVNIADHGDPVAVPAGRLGSLFQGVDLDVETDINPINPHSVRNYLGCGRLADVLTPYL